MQELENHHLATISNSSEFKKVKSKELKLNEEQTIYVATKYYLCKILTIKLYTSYKGKE